MPDLRIVTWNSTGESLNKAAELALEVNALNQMYPATPVMMVLNQEAQQGIGGAIYNMLNSPAPPAPGVVTIGPNYTRPPEHIAEMLNGGGAGYTMLPGNALMMNQPLTVYDYAVDVQFQGWVNSLPLMHRPTAWREVAGWRPPAVTEFGHAGSTVRLITWHAPIDLSGLLVGCTTIGKAPLDAFWFISESNILLGPNNPDIVIVAGDLNMWPDDLKKKCGGVEPLQGFTGETSNTKIDHILAWRPNGGAPQFMEARSTPSTSIGHDIFSCRVSW